MRLTRALSFVHAVRLRAAPASSSPPPPLLLSSPPRQSPQLPPRRALSALRASAPLLQKGGAAAKKGGGGGGGAAAAAPAAETFDLAKVVPCQLLKEGADPELQPDAAYPEWVFRLTEDRPLLEDLVMRGLEHVEPKDMKRVFRVANKRRIKAANLAAAKTS
jgi:large subunit ribosomal protein L54